MNTMTDRLFVPPGFLVAISVSASKSGVDVEREVSVSGSWDYYLDNRVSVEFICTGCHF